MSQDAKDAKDAERSCPECGGELVAGRRRDKIGLVGDMSESWTPGRRVELLGLVSSENQPVPVVTYACKDCGRLVSYLERRRRS